MLSSFSTWSTTSGTLECERAQRIIPHLQKLLNHALGNDVSVIFANDAHLPDDIEIDLWGEHAMKGTEGAEVIPELEVQGEDTVLEKRTYSGFYDTGLDQLLRSQWTDTLYLTGLHTNMCCRHTAADAYRGTTSWPLRTAVRPSVKRSTKSLDYLESVYGAEIAPTADIIDRWGTVTTTA